MLSVKVFLGLVSLWQAGMVDFEKSAQETDKIWFNSDSIRIDSIRYEIWRSRNITKNFDSISI
jgi:hypothetical protein